MNNSEASALLTEKLSLSIVPVALKFMDSAPADIETFQDAVPSACRFWREAERRTFFAPADAHFNCPVGAMVMGFDLPQAVSEELMELVGQMTKCGYLAAEEPARIPVNAKQGTKGVLYGPLSAFPGTPDAVLLWLTPAEAMVLSEATGGAHWGNEHPATAFGRPACAAIPQSAITSQATLSFGCIGMRTFTEIAPDRLLVVVPGKILDAFSMEVRRLREVNDGMEALYRERAANLPS